MLTAGKTLNKRYTIESILAQGGMSVLYLASDSHLPGQWVVKEMSDVFPNEEDRLAILDHFQKEVTILSMLNHQGLPKIIDYFESEGKRYLVEARPEDRFESAGEMREILTGPRGISVKAREYTYSPDHSYFFARRGIYYCSATILSALFFILSLPTESVAVIIIATLLSTWTGRKYISYLDVFRNRFTTTPQELVITHPLHSIHIPWSSIVALRLRKYQSLIPRKKSNPEKQQAFTTIQIDSCDVLYRHDHAMGLPESQRAVPSYDFFDDPKSREEKGFRSVTFSSQLRDCEELFRTIVMRARLKSSEEPGSIYVDEVFFR